jgi:hypothetical protein
VQSTRHPRRMTGRLVVSVLPEAVDLVGALDQHRRLRGPKRRSDRYGLWAVMPWHQPETLRNALDESMQFAYYRANIKSIVDHLGWTNET